MWKKCWKCKEYLEVENDFYGDVNCPVCGVQNSFYNPADYQPLPKEEDEMINYADEKYQGKFVYLPLMGQTAEFDIEEISEVKSDNPKFNFSENVPVTLNGEQVIDDEGEPVFKKKDLGYHVEAKLKNGKVLSVTSMSAFIQVFKKNEIQDGDKVRIFHKDKGEWEVTKL
jgi:phage FluMu protein Com